MSHRPWLLLALLALASPALPGLHPEAEAAQPTVDELLASIDANMTFDTRSSTMTMTVTKAGRVKTYQMRSFGRGQDEAAIEFQAPPRDAGTRMLKKGGELWMYLPSVEKTQRISGHMLRQGMMGSDFSYEDILEAADWRTRYKAVIVGEEPIDGAPCYKVEMNALSPDVSYPKRAVWVDKALLVPRRQELYALSGMMLKVITMSDVKPFGSRQFPTRIVAEDKLQQGSKTEIVFAELDFAVKLEEEVFSLRWLER